MKLKLLKYLCDPVDKSELELQNAVYDRNGNVSEGTLLSETGNKYSIRNGIPRFVERGELSATVDSFGDEWNYFNFDQFKSNWLNHTVRNTFGSGDAFKGKVIVDCGAGSGMQSLWMSQFGAEYVISLELSDSVDDVMKKNLINAENVDVIQCSIDHPPLKDGGIKGIVICHNVIQHTPSVEETARALWKIVGDGGEFVFNCYPKNDKGVVRKIRYWIHLKIRGFLSKRSFRFILNYARTMSLMRFIPIFGLLLEKANFMVRGEVEKGARYVNRRYLAGVLNTFDAYGSHAYQHYKSDDEIKALVMELQADQSKIMNYNKYFLRPAPIGCALRLFK